MILCIAMLATVITLSVINNSLQTTTAPVDDKKPDAQEPETKKVVFISPVENVAPVGTWGEMYDYGKNSYSDDHLGVDYFAEAGTEVVSAFEGTVKEVVKAHSLWGDYVSIEHQDGIITIYKGLVNLNSELTVGATIETGTLLGEIAETIDAEYKLNSHLHFEVMKDGSYIDPLTYFEGEEK